MTMSTQVDERWTKLVIIIKLQSQATPVVHRKIPAIQGAWLTLFDMLPKIRNGEKQVELKTTRSRVTSWSLDCLI